MPDTPQHALPSAGPSRNPVPTDVPQPFNALDSTAFPALEKEGVTPVEQLPEQFRTMRSAANVVTDLPKGMLLQFNEDQDAANLNQRGLESSFVTAFPNVARDIEQTQRKRLDRVARAQAAARPAPDTDDTFEIYQRAFENGIDFSQLEIIAGNTLPLVERVVNTVQAIQASMSLQGIGTGAMKALDIYEQFRKEFILGTVAGQPGVETTIEDLAFDELEIKAERDELTSDDVLAIMLNPQNALLLAPKTAINETLRVLSDPVIVLVGGVAGLAKLTQVAKKFLAARKAKRLAAEGVVEPPVPVSQAVAAAQSLQSTIASMKLSREVRGQLAQAGIDEGKVTISSIIAGKVPNLPAPAFQEIKEIFLQRLAPDLSKSANAFLDDLGNPLLKAEFSKRLIGISQLLKAKRVTEIEAGQIVDVGKVGGGVELKAIEQTLETVFEGESVEGLAYLVSKTRGNINMINAVRMATETQGFVAGALTQTLINASIAKLGVPFWNMVAVGTMTGVLMAETLRSSFVRGAAIPLGKAGAELHGLVAAYAKLLRFDSVMVDRIGEDATQMKKLFPIFHEGRLFGKGSGITPADPGIFGAKLQVRAHISASRIGLTNPETGELLTNVIGAKTLAHAVDVWGSVTNIPTGVVATADTLVRFALKTQAIEGKAYELAFTEANIERLAGNLLTKADVDARINTLRTKFESNPEGTMVPIGESEVVSLKEIGDRHANMVTMMQTPRGPAGKAASAIVSNSLIGRLFFRFPNVQIEALSQVSRRINPLAQKLQFVPSIRAGLAAGGSERARAIANINTSRLLASMGMALSFTGTITGSGPTDPEMRTIWQGRLIPGSKQHEQEPFTAYVGIGEGQRVAFPLDRWGTVGNLLGFWATLSYALLRIPDDVLDESREVFSTERSTLPSAADELASSMIVATANVISHPLLYEDIRLLVGGLLGDGPDAFKRFLERRTAGFSPTGVLFSKDINAMMDDFVRIPTGDFKDRVFARIMATIPGMPLSGTPYHDAWGDVAEITSRGMSGFMSRVLDIEIQPEKFGPNDIRRPIIDAMDKSRTGFSPPGRTVSRNIKDKLQNSVSAIVKLKTIEHERLKVLFGKEVELQGSLFTGRKRVLGELIPQFKKRQMLTMREALHSEINLKGFNTLSNGPQGQKQAHISKVVDKYKEAAMDRLLFESELEKGPDTLAKALKSRYGVVNNIPPEDAQTLITVSGPPLTLRKTKDTR